MKRRTGGPVGVLANDELLRRSRGEWFLSDGVSYKIAALAINSDFYAAMHELQALHSTLVVEGAEAVEWAPDSLNTWLWNFTARRAPNAAEQIRHAAIQRERSGENRILRQQQVTSLRADAARIEAELAAGTVPP